MFRFIRSFRPLLIMALVGSAVLFSPVRNQQPTTDEQLAISNEQRGDNVAENAGGISESPVSEFPQSSLLAQIFGATAVDPLFKLPDVTTSNQQRATSNQPAQEPQDEPARSIYLYLVASSEIGFQSDQSRLSIALSTADNGDTTTIERLIGDLEAQFSAFQALTPPTELRDVHDASSRVILRYINLLKTAKNSEQGSAKAAWQDPERTAIGEEATKVTQQIRDIVRTYNIALPEGVLP